MPSHGAFPNLPQPISTRPAVCCLPALPLPPPRPASAPKLPTPGVKAEGAADATGRPRMGPRQMGSPGARYYRARAPATAAAAEEGAEAEEEFVPRVERRLGPDLGGR